MRELIFGLSHYLALTILALTSYLYGRRVLLKLKFSSIWEEISFSIALGMGIIAYIVLLLGLLKILFLSVLCLVSLVGVLGCYPVWMRWFHSLTAFWEAFRTLKNRSLIVMVVVALVTFVILPPIFLLPLYPPTGFDATMYHLPYAKIYLHNHQIVLTPYLRYPVFPQVNEMLFTLMLNYDDISALLTQFLMMLLVAITLYAWGLRAFSSRVGLWAAAIWLANPLVIWLGVEGYIDVGLTLFVTLGAYAFFNWVFNKERYWLVIAGVFTGLAMGSKYSAMFFLGAFVLGALYISIRERRWTYPLVFGIIAICVAAPWYLRNIYYTGNPVFPFFGQIFGYILWSPDDLEHQLRELMSNGTGKSLSSFISLPWNLTFNSTLFNAPAPLSPIYFFTLPFLLLFGFRNFYLRTILILAFAYTLFWFFGFQEIRYLVPILPLLSLATAECLRRFLLWLPFLRKWSTQAPITALVLVLLISPGWYYAVDKVRHQGLVPVTQEQRDVYLAMYLPAYSTYKFLNKLKGHDYKVYALYNENMAYFADGIFMGDSFGPGRYSRILSKLTDGQALYRELRAMGADYFLYANWEGRVDLPQDMFLYSPLSHFKLIYSRADVSLFELTEQPVQRTIGPELLQNPSFEEIEGLQPSNWGHAGNPVIDASGQQSYSGLVAVGVVDDNPLYQSVPVKPVGHYVLNYRARAVEQKQRVRIQVNWADGNMKHLGTDLVVLEIGPAWKHYEITLTAPEQAGFAMIYASPHERGSAWFDDFSFKQIKYKNGQ